MSQFYKAMTVERNGKIIGAAFPHFGFRIVQVPYHDPDRDGMVNGKTHAIKFEPSPSGIAGPIRSELWGLGIGATGSLIYLQTLLARAVKEYNDGGAVTA
jgi:hypothetical protein